MILKTVLVLIHLIYSAYAFKPGHMNNFQDGGRSLSVESKGLLRSVRGWGSSIIHHPDCLVHPSHCNKDPPKPPSISCATVPVKTAPAHATSVRVTWPEPPGASRISGPAPGSVMAEGITYVTYKKTANGLSSSCKVAIRVQVIRCPTPPAPLHGTRSCTTNQGNVLYGDVCRFSCQAGFNMVGSSVSTCSSSAKLSASIPSCKPVPCGNPAAIANGHFKCNGNTFGSKCQVVCNSGYTADTSARSISCQADKHWSRTKGCLDRKPPLFAHCPTSKVITADEGRLSTKVAWEKVTATDPPTVLTPSVKQTKGPVQGAVVSEGLHHVEYTAVDAAGNVAVHPCYFNVTVHVVRCSIPAVPLHGLMNCTTTKGRMIYGDKCNFSCSSGYFMKGSSVSACSVKATMSTAIPICKPVPCGDPTEIANGSLSCNGNTYGSVCHVSCDYGYTVDMSAKSIRCQADRHWSLTKGCLDLKPPVFKHCPQSKVLFADRGGTTTNMKWERVTAIDPPTVLIPRVKQTTGPGLGTVASEGFHHVEYTAVDAAGNVAVHPCSFNVTVHAVRCNAPDLDNGGLLQYKCTASYAHGSECHVTCLHGSQAGPTKIVCEKDSSFPPRASWTWDNSLGIKPQCQVHTCPALRVPGGGALTCDNWQHGTSCQMQCHRGYTSPAGVPLHGIYVCGQNKTWFPPHPVPDCLATTHLFSVSMDASFYYGGHCDQSHSQEIRQNFITSLRASLFGMEMCKDVVACQARNVHVYCGSRITKRDQSHGVEIKVTFTFPYSFLKKYRTIDGKNNFRDNFISLVMSSAKVGSMDLGLFGLKLDRQKSAFSDLIPGCQKGQREINGTCAGCGRGFVVNDVSGSCVACPVGYYQDQDRAHWCHPCPLGHTTATAGSDSFQACKVECRPGQYSKTGLSPCFSCPPGSFQPDYRATNCLGCPPATLTPISGSDSMAHCQAYDLKLSPHGDAVFKQLSRDLTEWTYSVWFNLYQTLKGNVMLGLWATEYEQKLLASSLTNSTLHVYIQGNVSSSKRVNLHPTWNHYVLTASSKTGVVQVYINGQTVMRMNKTSAVLSLSRNSRLHILGGDEGVSVAGLTIHDYVLRDTEIGNLTRSCGRGETPRDIDLDSVDHDISSGIDITFPSLCYV